ncbi:MAG: ABC transporter ATP-binding protein [Anaerovoracaceae bacterium]
MIYEIKNLSFRYPGNQKNTLSKASFQLQKGEILTILGPNGAGKTTLMNCMAKLLTPTEGEILVEGKPLKNIEIRELAGLVSYVPQIHTPTFNYTVLDFVLMGRAPKVGMFGRPGKEDEKLCMELLETVGISSLANRSYMELSGGERQQVLIARAMVQEPHVILFDEPTAHLDFGNQHRVLRMIRQLSEKGYGIVMTTHNPDHGLLLGGKVAIVGRDGTILSGAAEEIITEANLKEIYQIDLKLLWVDQMGRKTCVVPRI